MKSISQKSFVNNLSRYFSTLMWGAALIIFVCIIYIYLTFTNALAKTSGEIFTDGLNKPVVIKRDSKGIPLIEAETHLDSIFALGYLHAQERFFQMDILRRTAQGTLSELVGKKGIEIDKQALKYKFEIHANQAYNQLPERHQDVLSAYTKGVNQGLKTLSGNPFEYELRDLNVLPWQPQDSLLVVYALYMTMQGHDYIRAKHHYLLKTTLPSELYSYIFPEYSAASLMPNEAGMPSQEEWTVREIKINEPEITSLTREYGGRPKGVGLVISAEHVNSEQPIISSDLNMRLSNPTLWFRVSKLVKTQAETYNFHGITLPGLPISMFGSNGHIAWSITSNNYEWGSLRAVPKEDVALETVHRVINVKGKEPHDVEITYAESGVVVGETETGEILLWHWSADGADAVNLRFADIALAKSVASALEVVDDSRFLQFDVFLADKENNIGWSILGYWPYQSSPKIINPEGKRIYKADTLAAIAKTRSQSQRLDSVTSRDAQISDSLSIMFSPDQDVLFRTLVDVRHTSLMKWQNALLSILTEPKFCERTIFCRFEKDIDAWNGSVDGNSVGFVLIKAFRDRMATKVFSQILAPVINKEILTVEDYFSLTDSWETPLLDLVESRPQHLLSNKYQDWNSLFLSALDDINRFLASNFDSDTEIADYQNRDVEFKHLFEQQNSLINVITTPANVSASGDYFLPKINQKNFGANVRLVLSPGEDFQGLVSMPLGQTANPFSRYWLRGHTDWVNDQPNRLTPGKEIDALYLVPTSTLKL